MSQHISEQLRQRIRDSAGNRCSEGGAMVLLKPLAKLCGPLPEEVQQRIHRLPFEQLSALGEALLDFRSLADLLAWLDENGSADG